MQQQRECLHVPAVDAQIGAIQHDALRISRKLGGDDLLDRYVFPVRAQQEVLRACERLQALADELARLRDWALIGERSPHHGLHHGEHVLHAMIELP